MTIEHASRRHWRVSRDKLETSPKRALIEGFILGRMNNGGASLPEIARELGMSQHAVEHHLGVLIDNKRVRRMSIGERGTRVVYYPAGKDIVGGVEMKDITSRDGRVTGS